MIDEEREQQDRLRVIIRSAEAVQPDVQATGSTAVQCHVASSVGGLS